jgi:hypothetical protein
MRVRIKESSLCLRALRAPLESFQMAAARLTLTALTLWPSFPNGNLPSDEDWALALAREAVIRPSADRPINRK